MVELSWVQIFLCGAELAVKLQWRRTMVHACWKSRVFSRRLKVLSDSSGARSEGGRLVRVYLAAVNMDVSWLWCVLLGEWFNAEWFTFAMSSDAAIQLVMVRPVRSSYFRLCLQVIAMLIFPFINLLMCCFKIVATTSHFVRFKPRIVGQEMNW